MRFSPQLRDLNWLVDNPIAHRGFHDNRRGIIENTESAFANAMVHGYAIECDLQLSADGEAMVFHDDTLERLTNAKGPVNAYSARELKRVKFSGCADRMQTLAEMLEQVDGRATLVMELKSHWDDDFTLAKRALQILGAYDGPFCLMSFDPHVVQAVCELSPHTVRGITADRTVDPWYNFLPLARRVEMRNFAHLGKTKPHFVSYLWSDLPYEPITEIRSAGHPVITWTLHSEVESSHAFRYCDQVTFEGYAP
jgi:glycerophosphoryl diester phosphodiesterase